MNWRPEGWQALKEKYYPDDPWQGFENGADAMLETLKKEGSYLSGETIISSQGIYPEIHVLGGTKGWVVIIPDV